MPPSRAPDPWWFPSSCRFASILTRGTLRCSRGRACECCRRWSSAPWQLAGNVDVRGIVEVDAAAVDPDHGDPQALSTLRTEKCAPVDDPVVRARVNQFFRGGSCRGRAGRLAALAERCKRSRDGKHGYDGGTLPMWAVEPAATPPVVELAPELHEPRIKSARQPTSARMRYSTCAEKKSRADRTHSWPTTRR